MPVPRTLRRLALAASLAAATTGTALVAAAPAHAVSTWWVQAGSTFTDCTQAKPCATVTAALAKAVAGDTINVKPGTYTDRPLVNKAITITGTGPGVVFQGAANAWALGVNTGTASLPVNLNLLTLTAGHYVTGGALPVGIGTVTATDVDITNSTSVYGGGAYVGTGSLTMVRGSVTGNTATATAANQGWGGGIYVNTGGALNLNGTTVSGNTADGVTKANTLGGGIVAAGPTSITNSTIANNTATATASSNLFGSAGGLYVGVDGVTVTGTTFRNNTATYVGGALENAKTVSVVRSTFDGNSAVGGGAIYAAASATLTGGSMTNNRATGNYGGAVWSVAPLVIDGTDIEQNTAAQLGGGIAAATSTTTVRNGAQVSNNTAPSGAGIYNSGPLTITGSTLAGNNAANQGGALYNAAPAVDGQTATITGTVFTGDTAGFAGGAITTLGTLNLSGGSMTGNSAVAGGGFVNSGTATLASTTISGNTATSLGGGGVFNGGRLTITDTTLDTNTATHTTGNTSGLGGAIYSGASADNNTSLLTVRRSTISHNQAYAGSALSADSTGSNDVNKASISDSTITANAASSTSGAIFGIGTTISVARSTLTQNTVAAGGYSVFSFAGSTVGVAGSIISGNAANACYAAVTDGGSNLVGSGTTTCGLGAAGPDPQLGSLAANGGQTQTQLPGPASPALDRIAAGATSSVNDAVTGAAIALCGGTDQRGTTRPQGAKCDIGAVEADQVAPTVSGPAQLDLTAGSASGPATYTSTGSPQPALSATGLPAGLTLTDNHDGTATLSGTPTGPGGRFQVTVKATNEAGTGNETVTIIVRQAPTLSGPTSDTFTVGQAGGPDVFTQTGGYPAATLSTGSRLPDGVTFMPGVDGDTGNATIAGTPAAGSGGVYPVTVTGSNGTGPDATWPFTLTVDEAPSLTGPATATYTAGTQGSTDLTVGGYPAPTLSATGLPAGLGATGHGVAGTPAAGSGGEYDATVTATNGIGADATHAIHLTVDEAPSVAGPQSVRMVAGRSTTVAYAAHGYPVAGLSVAGALPAGVTFHDNGNGTATLSGTPDASATGSYPVTITASNGIGRDATYDITIEVVLPVAITTTALGDATYGSAYDASVMATGGLPPYTFTVVSGSLPAGLTMGTDGHVTGSPTGDAGTSTFTVQVADTGGQTAQRQLSITVAKGATTLVGPPVLLGNGLNLGTVSATLTGGVPPHGIAGQTITFKAKTTVLCTAVTDANGYAACNPGLLTTLLQPILNTNLVATYAGSSTWLPSTAQMGLLLP
ncbi:MAG TPA: right-handed parallel beta-helix repeat-containing protein [Nocardioides sp.]|nr:right-handed parallel beta-helix repeat-containing protein [Nocardioides sp.]